MKITIDTKEDSKEEIRKAIRVLSAIVGDSSAIYTNASSESPSEKQHIPNIFSDEHGSSEQAQSVFGNLFGSPAPGVQSKETENKEDGPEQEPDKKPEIQVIDY